MPVEIVSEAGDPRLDDYRDLKEQRLKEASGKFVAESEGVVRKLLTSRLEVLSLLLTSTHLARLEAILPSALPVYLAPQAVVDQVAGFHVHRGCLAVGRRPRDVRLPAGARTVVVLEDLVDVDNVGALIRNAAAFDADAIVLSPRAADPYYRKAIRVSMGCVFALPILRCQRWPEDLLRLRDEHGLTIVGTVLDEAAQPLSALDWPERVAILFGAEGDGLAAGTKALCDRLVTIPMAREKADSLNVATAGALFLHDRARRRV